MQSGADSNRIQDSGRFIQHSTSMLLQQQEQEPSSSSKYMPPRQSEDQLELHQQLQFMDLGDSTNTGGPPPPVPGHGHSRDNPQLQQSGGGGSRNGGAGPLSNLHIESVFPEQHVGFDTLPQQVESRLLKNGFQFNIMAVGSSGLGKSTFLNTLFATKVLKSSGKIEPEDIIPKTTEIRQSTHVLEENGVRLIVNVCDTPGYGDNVNNDMCWEPILKYIKDQHSSYLHKELSAHRPRYLTDSRIHCCLFFIRPTGHGLSPIDVILFKKLTDLCNVIPVIAKSDSMTIEERIQFKTNIREELSYHGLGFYPYLSEDLDDGERLLNQQIQSMIPFAVCGSEKVLTSTDGSGKKFRGRQLRWGGVLNIEDPNQCEFQPLRKFLIQTHLQDLVESTHYIHYEAFRARQLLSLKDSAAAKSRQQQQQYGGGNNNKLPPQPPIQYSSGAF